jgi:hypothetical protein
MFMRTRVLTGIALFVATFPLLLGCGHQSGVSSTPSLDTVIDVSIRPSLLDSSTAVLQLKNQSGQSMQLRLSVHSNDSNHKTNHSVTVKARRTEEIGFLETGWMFEPNETVEISCAGYTSVNYKFFKTEKGTVGIKRSWW